ncbi:PREDICTED: ubiquitin-conjugating enzyme E2 U [Nanorana parkeri]|uniref:ubiquitin-conjugating enzyme E2 U n=1 Tax=Nanorana parkeri TaxID=125878 RepID=UPI000854FCFB|nr:PREDICTED: ubiquitin-conjugating enzyme E2 U [Nanorana parkeri]
MHSRTYLLLERDYEDLQETPLYGISVRPAEDNFLSWIAKVRGLKDSLWEGAALQVSLSYTEEYNYVPPTVIFNTIPFHPNVDPRTGQPCVDFLDKPSDWNPRYTMSYVLLAIQVLLSNPVLEDVVNLEAADALLNRPEEYRQMVLNCVEISRQIDAGSVQDYAPVRKTSPMEITPAQRKIKAISFEDYHKIWNEIATSSETEDLKAANTTSLSEGSLAGEQEQSHPYSQRVKKTLTAVCSAGCRRTAASTSWDTPSHVQARDLMSTEMLQRGSVGPAVTENLGKRKWTTWWPGLIH